MELIAEEEDAKVQKAIDIAKKQAEKQLKD
jgi:hypothetical protein